MLRQIFASRSERAQHRRRLDKALAANRFELLIDWRCFYFVTKPTFKAIDYFFPPPATSAGRFTFGLAGFSAGPVIYWAWNNTLSMCRQAFIMNRNGAKTELWDNLKGLFAGKKTETRGAVP